MTNEASGSRRLSAPLLALGAALVFAALGGARWLADTGPRIDPEALHARLAEARPPLVLDVRTREEYLQGRIPGAVHIHYRELPRRLAMLADRRHDEVVVYCETGVRSRVALGTLADAGFTRVLHLRGDARAWRRAGLPVERGPAGTGRRQAPSAS